MEGFSIKIDYYPENNDIVIIKLVGYVDQSNSHQIQKIIADLIQSSKQKFIFDLTELIYMSSAGWGIFVGEVKSVREYGGDIKVACMSPEIYDVFQVLEFYHILEDFSSVDEAVTSFTENGNKGIELLLKENLSDEVVEDDDETAAGSKKGKKNLVKTKLVKSANKPAKSESKLKVAQKPKLTGPGSEPMKSEVSMDLSRLPITEKIKKIVAIYPLISIRQINRMLRHDKFGSVKINLFKLYRMLRLLNLHTKKNRYRFYRSV